MSFARGRTPALASALAALLVTSACTSAEEPEPDPTASVDPEGSAPGDDPASDGAEDDASAAALEDACEALDELAEGLARIEPEVDADADDEVGTTGPYEALLLYYERVEPALDEGDAERLLDERVRPLEAIVEASPDDELPSPTTPEELDEFEAIWTTATWTVLPEGTGIDCPDHDTDERIAVFGTEVGGEATLDPDAVSEAVLWPRERTMETADEDQFSRELYEGNPSIAATIEPAALERGSTGLSIVWRTRLGLVYARWYLAAVPNDVAREDVAAGDAPGPMVEVAVVADRHWFEETFEDPPVPDEEGRANLEVDGSLLPDTPRVVPGDSQTVALLHDPTTAFTIAVSVATDGDVTADDLLAEVAADLGVLDP